MSSVDDTRTLARARPEYRLIEDKAIRLLHKPLRIDILQEAIAAAVA